MYSPRIRDDVIPGIYHAAREAGIAMTTWVNQLVERALSEGVGPEGKQAAVTDGLPETRKPKREND
jgi:hypothetical protein